MLERRAGTYEVTEVRADRITPRFVGGNRVVAYANVVLGGQLALNGLLVTENEPGEVRVAYPSKHPSRDASGKVRNLYYALTRELREEIWQAVKRSLDGRGGFRKVGGAWRRLRDQEGQTNEEGGHEWRI